LLGCALSIARRPRTQKMHRSTIASHGPIEDRLLLQTVAMGAKCDFLSLQPSATVADSSFGRTKGLFEGVADFVDREKQPTFAVDFRIINAFKRNTHHPAESIGFAQVCLSGCMCGHCSSSPGETRLLSAHASHQCIRVVGGMNSAAPLVTAPQAPSQVAHLAVQNSLCVAPLFMSGWAAREGESNSARFERRASHRRAPAEGFWARRATLSRMSHSCPLLAVARTCTRQARRQR
jgi:hypothetical protein